MGRGGIRRGRGIVHEGFGLELEELPKPVTSPSLFGNDAPLELEVGSGKGELLLTESAARPGVNFIGVEHAGRYWRYASDRARRHGRDNVRVVYADAAILLRDYIADDSLSAVHIYFPDPWPKRPHQRRRFVQPSNIDLVARKMRRGARLQVVTDHAGYFAQIERVVHESSLTVVEFDAPAAAAAPDSEEMVGTNFERKYRREGRAFHAIAASAE